MGQLSSRLTSQELQDLSSNCSYSTQEITKLYKRFKTLDKNNLGRINTLDLLNIPELLMNPFAHRILSIYDTIDQQLTFVDFIKCLSPFSREAKRETKLTFAFQIYDVNNDGFLCSNDLLHIVKLMVGKNLSKEQIDTIVSQTISDADVIDFDGKISYEEFKRSMFAVDFESILTIQI